MPKTYEGSVRKGRFYPKGKATSIPDCPRVILTILDEIILDDEVVGAAESFSEIHTDAESRSDVTGKDTSELRRSWLERLSIAIDDSMDEDFPDIHRSSLMLAPVGLSD